MELRVLRYFVATAEHGTVSSAADSLHVTQPGLSRQLRGLEQQLGVTLFDRSGGRLALSSAGRALLPLANDLLERAEAFKIAATYYATGRLERLTIGGPTVTLTEVVAPFVATLEPADPDVDVLAADGMTSAGVLGRGADLAIGTARPGAPHRSRPLAVVPVWAYVSDEHPWARRRRVTLTELTEVPVIGLPPTATARQALDAEMTSWGITPSSFTEVANGTLAQALAAAGRGVSVVSDDPSYGLVPLAVELPDGRQLGIRLVSTWDSRHAASATLEELARRLSAYTCERYGVSPA